MFITVTKSRFFSNSHFKFPLLPQSEKFATNGRVTGSKDDHTDGFSMTGA